MTIEITHFTDPACPFAFSAEPIRLQLMWHYGEQLHWRTRMIVLTLEAGEAEKLAGGASSLQRQYGMPIDPEPRARVASSEPACRAVVAARLNAPKAEEPLLRHLRVHTMAGGPLDDPDLIAAAAEDAGMDPGELLRWCSQTEVEEALDSDVKAARSPSPAAVLLDHKLSGPASERRYSAPSYELSHAAREQRVTIPGFNPIEAYEVALANLDPKLLRRPSAENVGSVLEWAPYPLATAEIAAVCELDMEEARAALNDVARAIPAGAESYWTLDR